MTRVQKKLREAAFFLEKMAQRAHMAFGDHEEFDFCLSAFLSASRSVDYRLRHDYPATYPAFWQKWEAGLQLADRILLKFMTDDRNLEVHEGGSSRLEQQQRITVTDQYSDASGTVYVVAAPGTPPAEVIKPVYSFEREGRMVPVVESCRDYLRLLQRLVAEFSAHVGAA